MKYVAPDRKYQVLIESHFCHVNNLMMDLLISVYLLQEYTFHTKFFFIVIINERSTILTLNMRSQPIITVKIDA